MWRACQTRGSGDAVLAGVHVGLRAIEREDLPQLLAWRNEPGLRQFFRERRELSMSDQIAWFERVRAAMFAIEARATGELLGACGLCYVDWVDRRAEVSVYIGAGGAYIDDTRAPDACRVLISHAFRQLDLQRLWVEIYAFDGLKARLFEELGFAAEGRLRQHRFHEGASHDSLLFGLLRAEQRQ
jgi:RimJ/RimL family protein N-acetyltransferase